MLMKGEKGRWMFVVSRGQFVAIGQKTLSGANQVSFVVQLIGLLVIVAIIWTVKQERPTMNEMPWMSNHQLLKLPTKKA